jgi:ubiquinone/menaquinone biosynthesis C-methylase UbiE
MNQEEKISKEEKTKRDYYDIVGQWNLPIVHMGGLKATEELLKMCQVNETSNLLDVGCGTGFTACQIAQKYKCRVVGIDLSENMVARAKERASRENLDIEFHVADVTDLPFEDGIFDVVIMESFLNILGKADIIKKALHEISRVTHPGGLVGANEFFADESTPPELQEQIRELLKESLGPGQGLAQYTPTEFKEFFEDAGLQVVQIARNPPMSIVGDVIKAMGWFGFIRYCFRAIYDILTNSELRKAVRKAAPAKRIMERKKDTKKFFGYVLIVGQK